jgi:hypothetical protein
MPWREKRLRCLSRPFESSGGDRRSVDHLERRRRRLSRDPVDGVPENYRVLQPKRISEFMRKEAFEYFWMTWKPRSCRTRRFSRRTVCLPLILPIGSRRPAQVLMMEATNARDLHHPAAARPLHIPMFGCVFTEG